MRRNERRGNWYLLTGLALGLGLGLLYAWVISPAQYIDTAPASLSETYKDEYRKAIALAYQADHDIGRARQRAVLVDPENPAQAMAVQAQRMLSENLSPRDARALAELAAVMGKVSSVTTTQASPTETAQTNQIEASQSPASSEAAATATLDPALAIQTATLPLPSATPTVTNTPLPTFTPRPTATPPSVQDSVFGLTDDQDLCENATQPGLLVFEVLNQAGDPLPGIRIVVSSPDREDTFYTGLSPEIDLGYADFQTQPGVSYTVKVGETSQPIEGIQTKSACERRLVFNQSK